jgi:O-antigen chain-terminating methyltransferase
VAEIKRRQSQYVDVFLGREHVIDLGCGRGEFLDVLADQGVRATGVDMSEDMADFCRDRGHQVELADAFEYLDRLSDESVDGIFAAQLIEHFRPEQVFELVNLCGRKLKPNGIFLVETVNPHCPAAMSLFYLDPTHIRPVPPEMLEFALEQGCFHIESLRFSAPLPGHGAREVLEVRSERPDEIALYQDYAVVATRR